MTVVMRDHVTQIASSVLADEHSEKNKQSTKDKQSNDNEQSIEDMKPASHEKGIDNKKCTEGKGSNH